MRLFLFTMLAALTSQLILPTNLVAISKDLSINTALTNNTMTIWIKKTGHGFASWGFGTTERADVFLVEFPENKLSFRNCLIAGQSPPSCFKTGIWVLSELVQYSNNNWAAKIEREIVNVLGVPIDPKINNVVFHSGNTTSTNYGFEGSSDRFASGQWDIRGQGTVKGVGLMGLVLLPSVLFLLFI